MTHKVVICREPTCAARMIFLPTRNGSNMPIDADSVSADDVVFDPPRHVSHYATCKKPNRFGKGKKK